MTAIPKVATEYLVRERAGDLHQAFERVEYHVEHNWGHRSLDALNRPSRWLLTAAEAARTEGNGGLLENACQSLFQLEATCQRYDQRRRTRTWLEGLRGEDAVVVARVLRASPGAARWYMEEGWRAQCDPAVRAALLQGAAHDKDVRG